MDVISTAAFNQYLITDTEERLVCVCMCVCVRGSKEGYQVGDDGIKCYICDCTLISEFVCLLLVAVTLLLHQIFHIAPPGSILCVWVCLCVCVREKEIGKGGFKHNRNQ